VDAELFGREGSVAKTLDPTGQRIPTYTIVAVKADDGSDAGYGYMEVVASGKPQTAENLLDVYRSLGAKMALSSLVGLDDVNFENVLLLPDRVQLIDMEATTGVFGDFAAQLWDETLRRTIQRPLAKSARDGSLTSAPNTDHARAAALE